MQSLPRYAFGVAGFVLLFSLLPVRADEILNTPQNTTPQTQTPPPAAKTTPTNPTPNPPATLTNTSTAQSGSHPDNAMRNTDNDQDDQFHHNHHRHDLPVPFLVVPYGTYTSGCPATFVTVCGQPVPVPAASIGYTIELNVPSPYAHQPFTAQCTDTFGGIYYQIIDSSAVTCAPLRCPPSGVAICGVQIPVNDSVNIGDLTTVTVPPAALSEPSVYNRVTFTAQCIDNGYATPFYRIADDSDVSCNVFPCADSVVRLCETSVAIRGGTPMGSVLHLTMPAPFVNDPFTVQCVGSGGNPPVYQVIDHQSVTCKTVPVPH
jgi:hypothetical protein